MSSASNVENLSPQIIRQVTKELLELTSSPPEGIRVVFNDEDVTDITANIDGPAGTPYHDGSFRVRLILSKDFPSSPPKAYFITKIFHPNVSRNGEICVNTLKKDWRPDLGLKHVLLTIKCLLIVPNAESALNEEAGKLLLEHYDDYCRRAKMITDIHARPTRSTTTGGKEPLFQEPCSSGKTAIASSSGQPQPKKHASEKAVAGSTKSNSSAIGPLQSNKNVNSKDKRRTLKRL